MGAVKESKSMVRKDRDMKMEGIGVVQSEECLLLRKEKYNGRLQVQPSALSIAFATQCSSGFGHF